MDFALAGVLVLLFVLSHMFERETRSFRWERRILPLIVRLFSRIALWGVLATNWGNLPEEYKMHLFTISVGVLATLYLVREPLEFIGEELYHLWYLFGQHRAQAEYERQEKDRLA